MYCNILYYTILRHTTPCELRQAAPGRGRPRSRPPRDPPRARSRRSRAAAKGRRRGGPAESGSTRAARPAAPRGGGGRRGGAPMSHQHRKVFPCANMFLVCVFHAFLCCWHIVWLRFAVLHVRASRRSRIICSQAGSP